MKLDNFYHSKYSDLIFIIILTPEEGRWTYRPKRCENSNKDEFNSPNIQNDEAVIIFKSKLVHTEVHPFSKGISTKVNVIAQQKFELAYFEASV